MDEITVMSFNMDHGRTKNGTVSLEPVARLVEEGGAGLVGLQDIDRFWPRSYFENQPGVLGRRLAMHHCFAPAGQQLPGGLGSGLAVLGRFPVIHHAFHRVGPQKATVLQRVAIDFDGTRVTVLNASLRKGVPPGVWADVLAILRALRTPAVLTIDTPAECSGLAWRAAAGPVPTKNPFHHGRPTGSIFFSPHWTITGSRIHRTSWSNDWALSAVAGLD